MKAWIQSAGRVKITPELTDKLSAQLLSKARQHGPGSVAGDATFTVDGQDYSGTVQVGGSAPDITFLVRSVAESKAAPAKKAAPKKAAPKKGKK